MRRFRSVVGLGALAVFCLSAIGIYATVTPGAGHLSIVGGDLVRTTADTSTVARAAEQLHKKLGGYVLDTNGRRSDPSYASRVRNWADDDGRFLTWTFEFRDQQERLVRLETTREQGRDLFIVVQYEGDPVTITNELVRLMQAEGVTIAN